MRMAKGSVRSHEGLTSVRAHSAPSEMAAQQAMVPRMMNEMVTLEKTILLGGDARIVSRGRLSTGSTESRADTACLMRVLPGWLGMVQVVL